MKKVKLDEVNKLLRDISLATNDDLKSSSVSALGRIYNNSDMCINDFMNHIGRRYTAKYVNGNITVVIVLSAREVMELVGDNTKEYKDVNIPFHLLKSSK